MNLHSAAADRQTYRENTIASFRRAAAAGASFVEFDVQVGNIAHPCLIDDVCTCTRHIRSTSTPVYAAYNHML